MAIHEIQRLTSVECDVTKFDFASIAPISFSLLDVESFHQGSAPEDPWGHGSGGDHDHRRKTEHGRPTTSS
jgi:hypothetical protein